MHSICVISYEPWLGALAVTLQMIGTIPNIALLHFWPILGLHEQIKLALLQLHISVQLIISGQPDSIILTSSSVLLCITDIVATNIRHISALLYVCVCLCVCHVCLCMCVCLYMPVSLCMAVCLCMCGCTSVLVWMHVCVCVCACLCI